MGAMLPSTKLAFATALCCSLALPGAASAATKTVFTGPPIQKPPAGFPKDGGINQFFPQSIKVAAGDSVKFQITGCPAVVVSKPGGAPAFVVDDAQRKVAGVKDAAGADFWFNGQAQPIANPAVFFGAKSGGTFAGTPVGSGFPAGPGAPKPWSVRLPKAGTYEMSCPLFAGMKGTITVVAKGKPVPSAKADAQRVKRQLAKAIAKVKRLDRQAAPAGNVITAGPDAKTGEILYRFTPAKKTVAVGQPVELTMGDGTREFHTFTFYTDAKATKKLAENSLAPLPGTGKTGPPVMGIDPLAALRSEPAATALVDDNATHGNGYVNTGLLDTDPKSAWPSKDAITFTKAGTYKYICLLHPEMRGEVTAR
jgi:plastocyanin